MSPTTIAHGGTDPSVDGSLLAYHIAGKPGVLIVNGQPGRVDGTHPAVGGARIAVLSGDVIKVRQTSGAPFALTFPAPGADALAVSAEWVAWRARTADGDTIYAVPLGGGAPKRVAKSRELGRPALAGHRLAYHGTGRTGSRIVVADLTTGKRTTVRRERRALLINPSLHGGELAYVRSYYRRQELRVGPRRKRSTRRDHRLWSMVPTGRRDAGHDPGKQHLKHGWPKKLWARPRAGVSSTLWTTALGEGVAYCAVLRQVAGQPLAVKILRVQA
jgi:hypothetical protein